jgi:hypothetical protein
MNNKNHWAVLDDYDGILCWEAEMQNALVQEDFITILKQVYKFACEEELYRIVRKASSNEQPQILSDVYGPDFSIWTDLDDGGVDFLTKEGLNRNDYEEQVNISYYSIDASDNGQIVKEWVGNFAGLAKKIYPEKYDYTYHEVLPLMINYNRKDYINIVLTSDIWLPKVVGWMDDGEPYYDNSELAALNTPRLNRFLQRTKELIQNSGGQWQLKGSKEVYRTDQAKKNGFPSTKVYVDIDIIAPGCEVMEDGISLKADTKPRNYWCIQDRYDYDHFPAWEARFPENRFKNRRDTWPLIKAIMEVGQQEKILQIFEYQDDFRQYISDIENGTLPIPYLDDFVGRITGESFANSYRNELEHIPEYLYNAASIPYMLYYDSQGEIVEDYACGFGKFGEMLRYSYHGYSNDHLFKKHAGGECFIRFFDHLIEEGYDGYLKIALPSDIWFPVVRGNLQQKSWVRGNKFSNVFCKGFDNRELANWHTPALNRLVAATAEKVKEMGGDWSVNEIVDPMYYEMMTPTGVKL